MVALLLEVECTEASLEEGGAVGQLLRENVFVTYHVISALFDDLFKKQRDFPNGYVVPAHNFSHLLPHPLIPSNTPSTTHSHS